jgi:hypothetical protein
MKILVLTLFAVGGKTEKQIVENSAPHKITHVFVASQFSGLKVSIKGVMIMHVKYDISNI